MPKRPTVILAADHGGWTAARKLFERLSKTMTVYFVTPTYRSDDDYPIVAAQLVQHLRRYPNSFGVGICRSGVGLAMVANKHRGIRAAQVHSVKLARQARRDENANVLSLGADYVSGPEILAITRAFIRTPFRPLKRYRRRLTELRRYESAIRN